MPKISVSSDSDALRVIAISSGSQPNSRGEVAADGLDARLEDRPHVADRDLVRELQVADHHVEHVAGAGLQPPLFRLTRVRSTSKARWIRPSRPRRRDGFGQGVGNRSRGLANPRHRIDTKGRQREAGS